MEIDDRHETTLGTTRPITPLEPEHETHPPSASPDRENDSADQEPPPGRYEPLNNEFGRDNTTPNNSDPPSDSSDEEELHTFDSDGEDPPPSDNEDDPHITLEHMKTNLQFIRMVEEATLESQFSPAELQAFRNPQENRSSPSDDPDLRLSILFYISTLNHLQSQKAYASNRSIIRDEFLESKMLSYDQVKRRVSDLSGLVTWKHHMCVDSCVGFTGPFADLEDCPRCHQPRYDQGELRKSDGKKKVPRKTFTTFALGPQLQSRWKSPEMAQKMFYRRNKTRDELNRDEDADYVYDDIFCGSDYLGAVENGQINDYDTVVMLSIDGAQLYRNKKSDCWIYIWVILDLAPDQRYKIRNILPGGVIPGPGHPKILDSFLFPGLAHISAIQKEGLHIWDGYNRMAAVSFLFLLLALADAVAMAELSGSVGHHGRKGCRLLCPLIGRNKLGGSHYYPALLQSLGADNLFRDHPDVDIGNLPPVDPAKYREDLNFVLESQTEVQYKQRRLQTGIRKATIFDGLPRILEPPTCFPGDIMHQPVINLTGLMFDLFCDREGCRKGDPNGVWEWAVLKGDVWKTHGKAVADAASYFPRSFDRTP